MQHVSHGLNHYLFTSLINPNVIMTGCCFNWLISVEMLQDWSSRTMAPKIDCINRGMHDLGSSDDDQPLIVPHLPVPNITDLQTTSRLLAALSIRRMKSLVVLSCVLLYISSVKVWFILFRRSALLGTSAHQFSYFFLIILQNNDIWNLFKSLSVM